MSSLLSSTDITLRTGVLGDLFDTVKRPIVIFKEPIKIISNTGINVMFGYEETSTTETQITYTPISGVYDAQILYARANRTQNSNSFANKIMLNPNSTYIKVREDARNYIKNKKTELIQFDEMSYNVEGSEQVQDYLGLKFYYFELKGTN